MTGGAEPFKVVQHEPVVTGVGLPNFVPGAGLAPAAVDVDQLAERLEDGAIVECCGAPEPFTIQALRRPENPVVRSRMKPDQGEQALGIQTPSDLPSRELQLLEGHLLSARQSPPTAGPRVDKFRPAETALMWLRSRDGLNVRAYARAAPDLVSAQLRPELKSSSGYAASRPDVDGKRAPGRPFGKKHCTVGEDFALVPEIGTAAHCILEEFARSNCNYLQHRRPWPYGHR